MNAPPSLEEAVKHHQAGRLPQAEAGYRAVLAAQPANAQAMHLLGVVRSQLGQKQEAIQLIERAIAISPSVPDFHSNLGLVCLEAGDAARAVAACRRSLQLLPDRPGPLFILANALRKSGQAEEAIATYRRVLALHPQHTDAAGFLAQLLGDRGQFPDAAAAWRRVVELRPQYAEAHMNLAHALLKCDRLTDALAAYDKAAALRPDLAAAQACRGAVLEKLGRTREAIECQRKAIAIDPHESVACNNLGFLLSQHGDIDEAANVLRDAVRLRPHFAEAWNNLANTLREQGRFEQAMRAYEKALFFQPDFASAQWNKCLLHLLLGEYHIGWLSYEWRWLNFPARRRAFDRPRWDGSDLAGRTLFVHVEQGLGDTIQFARYAMRASRRGGPVVLECQPELQALLATMPEVSAVVAQGSRLPAFNLYTPLISLPALFETTPDSIPFEQPYLAPDPGRRAAWAARLGAEPDAFRVGLAWAGDPAHGSNRTRSCRLQEFAPLARARGVRFYSLQKGAAAAEGKTPPAGIELADHTAFLNDMADTAAFISQLDLVITVDTSVAHLAGAIGKPVWNLISFNPDWRWMLHRTDTPWYPSMRLFRQPTPGDWKSALEAAADALAQLSSSGSNAARAPRL